MFWLLLLVSATTACPLGQCTTIAGDCVPSILGVQCGECDWTAWLDGSTCVPNLPPTPCAPGSCRGTSGECLPSDYGVRCSECFYRGYLAPGGVCVCYSTLAVPALHCASPFPTDRTEESLVATVDSVWCEAFQSHMLGCFATVPRIEYGESGVSTPSACCSDIYGPPIGQLVEDGSIGWQECNTYGTFDPDEPAGVSPWRTCSGHGRWNAQTYRCECSDRWNGLRIGVDFFDSAAAVYSCRECFGFWGPRPTMTEPAQEVEKLHCSVLMAPDENGDMLECAGHGDFVDGVCVCYADEVNGYWALRTIEDTFIRTYTNGSRVQEIHRIAVCLNCAAGAGGTLCLNPNASPPTDSVVTTAPSPPNDCLLCSDEQYPGTALRDVEYLRVLAVPIIQQCCDPGYTRIDSDNTIVTMGGTCDGSADFLGLMWCMQLGGCTAYTWTKVFNGTEFRFVQASEINLVLSPNSGSGRTCPPTHTPTSMPTSYPTAYPTSI